MASSNHRRLFTSSDSSHGTALSATLETDIAPNLRLAELLERTAMTDLPILAPEQPSELGRMLAMKSVISTSSLELSKIGAGTCGVILTQDGSNMVFKMAKHNTDALTGDIFNDFKMHAAVCNAMLAMENKDDFPRTPRLGAFIAGLDKAWWDEQAAFSSAAKAKNVETPCDTLCSERIVPLPLTIRSRLINTFCPETLRDRAHKDPSNEDCLVRVYLGGRKEPDGPRKMFFSLRNYKLHLNQMLELGMDIKSLGRAMAGALAVMHWKACIDAKDVEFVLGSSPPPTVPDIRLTPARIAEMTTKASLGAWSLGPLDWHHRVVDLWLLDFNLCSTITMDDSGIDMAAKAWAINDPYYPRPLQENAADRELWNVFVRRYIEVSDQILVSEDKASLTKLPRKFIAKIVQIQQERKEGKK